MLLNNPGVILLNEYGTPTHINISNGSTSIIDLSIATTTLAPVITWRTHSDLCDSDHHPIILTNPQHDCIQQIPNPKWMLHKADWPLFRNLTSSTDGILSSDSIEQDVQAFTEFLIQCAEKAIPKSVPHPKKRSVPWWSPEIAEAITARKKALTKFQKTRNPDDLIDFRKRRAKARYLLRFAKKQRWHKFVANINGPVPSGNSQVATHLLSPTTNHPR